MKCPKCGRFSLAETAAGVRCKFCGHELTPGQVDRYRLFKLLREEGRSHR
jgi:ribosomal protein L37AE/L43A